MDKLQLILFAFSFVCFVLACWQVSAPYFNRLVAAGLAFFAAAFIFGGAMRAFGAGG